MVQMRSKKELVYAGRRIKAGDVFQTRSDQDAKILAAIGKAERYTAPAVAPNPPAEKVVEQAIERTRTVHVTSADDFKIAESAADAEAGKHVEIAGAEATEKPKRAYRRRDLTAE